MALQPVGLKAVFQTADFQRGVQIYTQGVTVVNQGAKNAEQQSKRSSKAVSDSWEKSFAAVAKKAAVAVAAFVTAQKATQFMREATLLAARVETLGVALETVGKNAGYSSAEIAKFEEAVKAQGITTQGARQALLMMGQAQIDFAHAADLARIAQDAAVIAGTDSSDAFQRLTYVIQTGNIRMARTLGLQVSFQRGYERMAAQLGKTTDALDEQERVQARVNVVMQAGTQIAGTYEAAMTTAGKLMYSLNRLFEETQLVIGQINLGGFAVGIDEVTRLVKELLEWMGENEQELEEMGVAVEQLVGAMVAFADLELPTEDLTTFVERLTTLTSILAVGIEIVGEWNAKLKTFQTTLEDLIGTAGVLTPAFQGTLTTIGDIIDRFTEMREEMPGAFKTFEQAARDISKFQEPWVERAEEEAAAQAKRKAAQEDALAAYQERLRQEREAREKQAEAISKHLDRVQKLQRDHNLRLQRQEEDAVRERARAWDRYGAAVAKEIEAAQERIADITERHEKRRASTLRDAEKRFARAERDAYKDRERAQREFDRRRRQQRERARLDEIQSERRYQFNWARLLAEGDALALYYLQQEHALEQEEAAENQGLQQKQAEESYRDQIKDMEDAAADLVDELRESLAEQLAEQEQNYREQIAKQKEANAERLDEMAANFAEQQRLRDEDREIAARRREEDYERQLGELGAALADQEELQDAKQQDVARVLERYYGEGGVADEIMEGYHERRRNEILVTAAMMQQLAEGWKPLLPGGIPMPGQTVGMDQGGVVRGPATVQVGAGMVEAFVPLGRFGGDVNVGGNIGVNVSGLERAAPSLVNRIAAQVGTKILGDLTSEMRTRRRE